MSANPQKNYEIGRLLDVYGALLTERQRDVCELYYDDDLSLGEVAEECGISRQGVRDALIKSEGHMRRCEEALGLLEAAGKRKETAQRALALLERLRQRRTASGGDAEDLEELQQLIQRLS